ncbi:Myb-like_DNA-binding domain-containing protein [Hexamita inflata]|uniref:Myb-like DNA-binding domain-containing protein n=1 Tax=Hexamita inflata TaxID=28002 RepID=A0AA86TIU5_9EUKA|nr:Myb-like DNA-binding domain-containing protein [Hexamita inflata]
MSKVPWNSEELAKLTQLTEKYRENKQNVNWDQVAAQIHSRTASQCKSYYANILKKQLNVQIRQNHMWNYIEILALWTYSVIYKQDFAMIHAHFMPKFTVKQLTSQYQQILRNQKQIIKTFSLLNVDPSHIEQLSNNDFKLHLKLLLVSSKRQKLIDTRILNRQDEKNDKYPIDFSEIAALKAFFGDLDVEKLLQIYKTENGRRKLEEEFEVPDVDVNFRE